MTPPDRRLVLPPPYAQRRIAGASAFSAAVKAAPQEGAGLLVWRHKAGLLEAAVVLEPDRPLRAARLAAVVGLNAVAEALGAHGPAERKTRFVWPLGIVFDKGRLGGGRLAVAPCAEESAPEWMAFGFELIADRDHLQEPGLYPGSTSLKEEGFEDPAAVVESFAAWLMLGFDRWTHQGWSAVAASYLARLEEPALSLSEAGLLEGPGLRRDLKDWIDIAPWRGDGGPLL